MTYSSSLKNSLSELDIIQNPALGAYLLWRFGHAYQSETSAAPSFLLLFLVLPLLLHRPTLDLIFSTNKSSGLALFAAKLGKEQEQLLAVHERALLLRSMTLESLSLAIRSGLVKVDYREATVRALDVDGKIPTNPERLKNLIAGAGKLGYWFSKLGLSQITATLKVDF